MPSSDVCTSKRRPFPPLRDSVTKNIHRRFADEGGDVEVGGAVLQVVDGAPYCMSLPSSITAMRSARASASV